jgi:hypothetical protein
MVGCEKYTGPVVCKNPASSPESSLCRERLSLGDSIYCNKRKRQLMPFTAISNSDNIIDCNKLRFNRFLIDVIDCNNRI